MKGGLLLDVVVSKGPSILQLLPSKDQPLLVRRYTLLVLNFSFHVVNSVGALHLQGDGLPCEGLDEDLHASSQPQHQVEGGLLLDVVVSEGTAVL